MLKTREESFEVVYADELLTVVSRDDIAVVERRIHDAKLKRTRLCVHRSHADALHEMFIVQSPETYIRPHKHLGKAESLLVLAGRADVVFFAEDGDISDVVRLGDYQSGLPFFYRLGEATYHSLIIRTPTFIFKEATQGPFDKTQTLFAPWSPAEADAEAARGYMTRLSARVRARGV